MKLLDKPFVAIYWADAHSSGSVTEYAEHELPHRSAHYTTYGFLLRDDADGLTLATEHSDEHTYRGVCFIPRAMVVDRMDLTLTHKRAPRAARAPVVKDAA
jgi:hypothetical protein